VLIVLPINTLPVTLPVVLKLVPVAAPMLGVVRFAPALTMILPVPSKAVVFSSNVIQEDADGNQFVFEIASLKDKTGIAKKVIVKVGKTSDNFTEILSGLEPKTLVVGDGVKTVSEGMKLNF